MVRCELGAFHVVAEGSLSVYLPAEDSDSKDLPGGSKNLCVFVL